MTLLGIISTHNVVWLLLLLVATTTTRTIVLASTSTTIMPCFAPSFQHNKNCRSHNDDLLANTDQWGLPRHCISSCSSTTSLHARRTAIATTTTTTTTKPLSRGSSFWASSTALRFKSSKNVGEIDTQTTSSSFKITNTAETVICGGGPAGLLAAIMLAQKFPNHRIHMFDRQKEIPASPTDEQVWSSVNVAKNKFLIGLGGRGITALQKYGVWEDVEAVAVRVPGRKDWVTNGSKNKKKQSPLTQDGAVEDSYNDDGVERMLTDRKFLTHVLPRDKLVSVLYEHLLANYYSQVTLHYGRELEPVDFDWRGGDGGNRNNGMSATASSVLVRVVPSKFAVTNSNRKKAPPLLDTVVNKILEDTDKSPSYIMAATKLFVVADGNTRTMIQQMTQEDEATKPPWKTKIQVKRYVDDNARIFKSIPFQLPPYGGWKTNLNYSVRAGKVVFDALPVKGPDYCGVLLLPEAHPMAQANADVREFDSFLQQTLPQFYPFFTRENIAKTAQKDPSYLPTFSYLGPRLYHLPRTVMVGDCVKTVKPYFGMGANSALEDVAILGECIDNAIGKGGDDGITSAIIQYSKRRAKDIKKLVTLSHGLDRPGPLGTASFLIPIILDGMFRGMFPMFFQPNIITMMQNEKVTFRQAAKRKRLDRIGQLTFLGFFFWGLKKGTRFLLRKLTA